MFFFIYRITKSIMATKLLDSTTNTNFYAVPLFIYRSIYDRQYTLLDLIVLLRSINTTTVNGSPSKVAILILVGSPIMS